MNISGLIVYALEVIGAIFHSKKSKKLSIASTKEEIKAQMFTEYTRRYNEIILHMPNDSSEESVLVDSEKQRYLRLYFNLCNDEYHSWKKGMIDSEVWESWKESMRITMNNRRYVTAWIFLSQFYNRKFWLFFQGKVIDWKKDVAATSDTKDEKKSRKCSLRAIINKIKNNIKLKK